jgi:hypothetical protein
MLPTFIFGWDATASKAYIATGGPPRSEAEHYFRCEASGGYFDMRDLSAMPVASYPKLACFLKIGRCLPIGNGDLLSGSKNSYIATWSNVIPAT